MAVGNAAIDGLLKCRCRFWFRAAGLLFEINFIRSPIIQRLVESFGVVKPEITIQVTPRIRNRRILMKVNLFVFDTTPKALNENVVEGPAATVHADQDVSAFQNADKRRAGKLNALIGVHDFRL